MKKINKKEYRCTGVFTSKKTFIISINKLLVPVLLFIIYMRLYTYMRMFR